jgi:hypothetical protein
MNEDLWLSLRTVSFFDPYKMDPPQADVKSSIFNLQFLIYVVLRSNAKRCDKIAISVMPPFTIV